MLLKGTRKVCNEIVKTDLVSGFRGKSFSYKPVRMTKTEPESASDLEVLRGRNIRPQSFAPQTILCLFIYVCMYVFISFLHY